MNYDIENINRVLNGELVINGSVSKLTHLLTDSRKLIFPDETLFFALITNRRNGHDFINNLYQAGVRNFVVSRMPGSLALAEANFIVVPDTILALQQVAAAHRHRFNIPVIGITGSNGKTVVKEWLNQLLDSDFQVVRSPASYNSQIGVPMSVWLMNDRHELAIFEAGISKPGEMIRVQPVIDPTIGIFTNIGEAHSEGFETTDQKIAEKILLFTKSGVLIFRSDDERLTNIIKKQLPATSLFSWGANVDAQLRIISINKESFHTNIIVNWRGQHLDITIPFTDNASAENAIHCLCVMLYLGISHDLIRSRMKLLNPVAMRLEMKSGINNSSVINDSYSSDVSSLRIALDFMSQQKQHVRKTVILSDILQSGRDSDDLYREVAALLEQHQVNRLIGIGSGISNAQQAFRQNEKLDLIFFDNVTGFKKAFSSLQFRDETILIKGARVFELEGIDQLLQQKVHQTVLEINLTAVVHNLNEYRKILAPSTKVMAMVKAFSYGSGSFEIANVLQFYKADYLAVAYADEGVALRKAGIGLPIMVMNTDNAGFDVLVEYHLEPDLYSFEIFNQFTEYLRSRSLENFPVHLEMETGMNRLGFGENDIEALARALKANSLLKIRSVFSHLAASEDPEFDDFTRVQFTLFKKMAGVITDAVGYPFLKHISNTSGVSRHPEIQLDMIRLGIGLYGIDKGMDGRGQLREVSTLKSTVAQIKHLRKNESVGYGRRGRLTRDSVIATVRLGYADGYSRKMGNGRGQMIVNGGRAPVCGSICMDMTMIDITDIPGVSVGDEAIVFGAELPVQELAGWAETIPYEILTSISQRVKRVYFEE